MTNPGPYPAAFIDRDGVINRDHGYVSQWEDFEFLPEVIPALGEFQTLGYQLVIVTNQSGIGRGYYDESAFWRLTEAMVSYLAHRDVRVSGVYFCPHHPDKALGEYRRQCDCRKPAPGMLLRAAEDLDLSLADSILVGDKASDIQAGQRAGVARCYHVTQSQPETSARGVASLAEAARCERARSQNS